MEGSGNGGSLSVGALSSFTGDPEGYVKEGSENKHLSPEGPQWENLRGGGLISWRLKEKKEGSIDEDNLVHVSTQHILLHIHAFCIQT